MAEGPTRVKPENTCDIGTSTAAPNNNLLGIYSKRPTILFALNPDQHIWLGLEPGKLDCIPIGVCLEHHEEHTGTDVLVP